MKRLFFVVLVIFLTCSYCFINQKQSLSASSLQPRLTSIPIQSKQTTTTKSIIGRRNDVSFHYKVPLLSKLVSWALQRLIHSHVHYVSGLDTDVTSKSNLDIIRGKLAGVKLNFDKICFGDIFVTGGGKLALKNVEIEMKRLLFLKKESLCKPYLAMADLLLTQSDVVNSKLIRGLFQQLVDLILSSAFANALLLARLNFIQDHSGMLKVLVKKVTIAGSKIHVHGDALSVLGATAGVTISFGVACKPGGHIINVKDIQLVINADSNMRTTIPINLPTPLTSVNLGSSSVIKHLHITNSYLWARLNVNVSPRDSQETIQLQDAHSNLHQQQTEIEAAHSFDLSNFLSSLLKLQGGMIPMVLGLGMVKESLLHLSKLSNLYQKAAADTSNRYWKNQPKLARKADRQGQQEYLPSPASSAAFNLLSPNPNLLVRSGPNSAVDRKHIINEIIRKYRSTSPKNALSSFPLKSHADSSNAYSVGGEIGRDTGGVTVKALKTLMGTKNTASLLPWVQNWLT